MSPPAAPIAQLLVDRSLTVAQADSTIWSLVGGGTDRLIGLPFPDLLVPEDRDATAALLAAVLADGIPRVIAVRWMLPDGGNQPTDAHVSRFGCGEDDARLALACWNPAPASPIAAQWQIATMLLHGLRSGRHQFGDDIISSPPAEILLMLYLAEAEGRSGVAGEIARQTKLDWRLAQRWLRVLIGSGFVELERDEVLTSDSAVRLSGVGDQKLQRILGGLGSPFTIGGLRPV